MSNVYEYEFFFESETRVHNFHGNIQFQIIDKHIICSRKIYEFSVEFPFQFEKKNELRDRYRCILVFSYALTIPKIYRNRNQHHFRFSLKIISSASGGKIYKESRTGNL